MDILRPSRSERDQREQANARARYDAERRLQAAGLLVLGLVVLLVAVLRTGIHNVFLPGWWRLW